jgi:isopentenyl phosphate kinase
MIIIKLGGSVITDKSKNYCFRKDVVARLASEIKNADRETIIVHGAGSFGHIPAETFKLNEGYQDVSQIAGFSFTHISVRLLNLEMIDTLLKSGINVFSIPPSAIMRLKNHEPLFFNYEMFEEALKKGFTPVTFGDVVFDDQLSFSICSGDLLVELLAKHFKPEKVIFVIDEDGLYTSNPKVNREAKFIESISFRDLEKLKMEKNKHADVTGGMYGKINVIQRICKLGIDSILLNGNYENRLYNTIMGKPVKGTIVCGEKK